ncbi:MAG TPA: choice-of-anchor B family protein [Balneolaceae bacterium]
MSLKHCLLLSLFILSGILIGCGKDNPVNVPPANFQCIDGMSAGRYACQNIDLLAHLSPQELLGENLNDIWGWTDPETGKEYALVGMTDGVTFVDISNPSEPVVIGKLEESVETPPSSAFGAAHDQQLHKSAWRDLKVYKNHVFVVSDAQDHGMQVFDLTRLRDVSNPPVTFTEDVLYNEVDGTHNIAINTETGFAYLVGSNTYGGGLHIVDISNPLQPQFAGFHSDTTVGLDSTGYVHDTQCVIYQGADVDYQGEEICFNSSETHFVIANVSDKSSTYTISKADYEGVEYAHQGWLTEDHNYFLMDDELDELFGRTNTRTIIWDVRDLDNPKVVDIYVSDNAASDHNQYIKDDLTYQANYQSGLRILRINDIATGQLEEIAYFDTYPQGNAAGTEGAWSNYPYFESGVVIVSDITNGLFILRPRVE